MNTRVAKVGERIRITESQPEFNLYEGDMFTVVRGEDTWQNEACVIVNDEEIYLEPCDYDHFWLRGVECE